MNSLLSTAALVGTLSFAPSALAQVTSEAPMLRGDTTATGAGWDTQALFTVGESINGYQPVGILDGLGAFKSGPNRAVVLVNHELSATKGYNYTLKNGTSLTGARVSAFTIHRGVDELTGLVQTHISRAHMAYDTIYDRMGLEVTSASQINENGSTTEGLSRLCSAQHVHKGSYGFVSDLFLTGEENGKPFAAHGGTEWVLDVRTRSLHAAPALGRGSWENVTALDTGSATSVALLLGDDTQGAPLYLYVGEKDGLGTGTVLDRNGLAKGKLYAWKADAGDLDPQTFNGLNSTRTGQFVEVFVQDPAMAGMPGYDIAGYLDSDTLQAQADTLGCFSFSRPEDLATNPTDGTQAAFASTGRGALYPADNWGTTYVVDVDFKDLSAELVIVHDADGLVVPDLGIRSPDNLEWADDGKLYIQEDRSTSPSSDFGAVSGVDASVWTLDPVTRAYTRIAEVDRTVLAPAGTTDSGAGVLGHWETSGILDVTSMFETFGDERLLLGTVQAHGISDGPIGGDTLLAEGGQLVFLSKRGQ